ncbi:unnamed protein product [Trichogramma brassicae]|uniref:Uncharacterized protein n=1 Tax=Trichogramma brassicae TaxID=86971 RepID=A0A6H5IRJ6_9HYME|nr:unnamed protein product [Trichogramma brassicae]
MSRTSKSKMLSLWLGLCYSRKLSFLYRNACKTRFHTEEQQNGLDQAALPDAQQHGPVQVRGVDGRALLCHQLRQG